MTNISFKANLIVHENLYKQTPEGYTDKLVERYKGFLDHRIIKSITKNDTIELYKDSNHQGFGIGIKYTDGDSKKVIESGIYTNKKNPSIGVESLVHNTVEYIILKSGIKPKYSEGIQKSFQRAVQELLKKKSTQ